MALSDGIYLVFFQNGVVGAFATFDMAVEFVRKRYGKTPELRHVVISSVPFNPPARGDEEG